jgi:hypothetical protein
MKSLTIRLPDALASEIEQESRARKISKSDVVRERLGRPDRGRVNKGTMRELVGDLVGSVIGLPADLSAPKRKYLPI